MTPQLANPVEGFDLLVAEVVEEDVEVIIMVVGDAEDVEEETQSVQTLGK